MTYRIRIRLFNDWIKITNNITESKSDPGLFETESATLLLSLFCITFITFTNMGIFDPEMTISLKISVLYCIG